MTDIKIPRDKTKPRLKFLFTHANFAIGDKSEVRGVALYERREAYFQLGLKITRMSFDEAGLPAPGHKVLVLVHVGDHIVQLLRRIPENTHGSRRKILASKISFYNFLPSNMEIVYCVIDKS